MNKHLLYIILYFILLLSVILTLTIGETEFIQVWKDALAQLAGSSFYWNPLLDERLPRLIVLLCTGASLAVAGTVTQALFQNPLASPGVLGIPAGGSLLVVIIFICELHYNYPYAIPIAAFIGCLGTLLVVYSLSRRKGYVELTHMVLTGIAVSTLIVTIQSSIIYAFRDRWHIIQTLTEWEAGSTSDRSWMHVHLQLPLTLFGLSSCWLYSKEINMMAFGEEEAKNLGVEVDKIRWRLFLSISLLISGAVAAVGNIAFFGLLLPHLIRRFAGPNNQQLIPLAILGGAAILTAMDVGLRFFSLQAFSIGNISGIMGGIFFLCILMGSRYRHALLGKGDYACMLLLAFILTANLQEMNA
ncbi:iron ABC transporter permease [Neochlamydia sp. EPS4]|uniref:FecCD family ABC transporter permease n=1 Tax=Neochlamydia sp. EPS4 TaxID=1478175 RepID=UPI000693B5BF|nr:iron ABC transporter permease [Neochlamydia sp. EPS4]